MIRVLWNNPDRRMAEATVETLPDLTFPAWTEHSVCASIGGIGWDLLDTAGQVAVCQNCDVIYDCAEYGICNLDNTSGGRANTTVYGGLTPDQIVAEVRRRREGVA